MTSDALRRAEQLRGKRFRGKRYAIALDASGLAMPTSTQSRPNKKGSSVVAGRLGRPRRDGIFFLRERLGNGEPAPRGGLSSAHVAERLRATMVAVRGRLRLSGDRSRDHHPEGGGMPMKSVARKMTISEETAKQYLGRVKEKYSRAGRAAPTKLELYYRAVEDGHLPHSHSHDPPPW